MCLFTPCLLRAVPCNAVDLHTSQKALWKLTFCNQAAELPIESFDFPAAGLDGLGMHFAKTLKRGVSGCEHGARGCALAPNACQRQSLQVGSAGAIAGCPRTLQDAAPLAVGEWAASRPCLRLSITGVLGERWPAYHSVSPLLPPPAAPNATHWPKIYSRF